MRLVHKNSDVMSVKSHCCSAWRIVVFIILFYFIIIFNAIFSPWEFLVFSVLYNRYHNLIS